MKVKCCAYNVAETLDFVLFTVLMCFDSMFKLFNKVTDGSVYLYGKG